MDNAYPLLLSWLTGFLLLKRILKGNSHRAFFLELFLSWGLGLGVTAAVVFSSFWVFDRLNPVFITGVHFLVLGAFLLPALVPPRRWNKGPLLTHWPDFLFLAILASFIIPLWIQANMYPYGGWDAWTVWNLKAKFLFLGGENWTAMLESGMWRSSPHYPLLLPLINTWTWMGSGQATHWGPLLTAVGFSAATAGVLMYGLKSLTGSILSFLPGVLILSSSFFLTLAVSQYADIVLAFYLLAAVVSFMIADRDGHKGWALLAGLFVGFLSFTKAEGAVAAVILIALMLGRGLPQEITRGPLRPAWILPLVDFLRHPANLLLSFITGAAISGLPALLFYLFLSPGNQTFINGLFSATHPVSWQRLVVVTVAFPLELISSKWNGLWIILMLGMFLGGKKIWDRNVRIIPFFLLFYLLTIAGYYVVNTHFEVIWFITSSLNRIIFALLPTVVWWVFYAVLSRGIRDV
jgi:hypothetical protein